MFKTTDSQLFLDNPSESQTQTKTAVRGVSTSKEDEFSSSKQEREKEQKEERKKDTHKREKRRLSGKKRRALERKLHQRIHFGKTQHIRSTLREVYGVDLDDDFFDNEECDACAWAKAKLGSAPKHSHRKATRVGERLHFDVFTSSVRSHNGMKYLLVIADEYSDWIWAYGMKNKSETKHIVRLVVRRVERKTGREA